MARTLKCSITGWLCSTNVRKRLTIVSSLSSARPLVLPRSSSRARMSSSEHSMASTMSQGLICKCDVTVTTDCNTCICALMQHQTRLH